MKGKTALITGASQGIGKSIAVALAKEGVNIIVNDIAPASERAEATVSELKEMGVEAMFVAADVSSFESCKQMVDTIKTKFEKVDILVNNAGITKDRTLKKMTPEEWNAVINVNLNGVYNVTHNMLSLIPEGGRVISLSSVVAFGGNFGQCNYSSTKAALIGFTKSLAKELGKQKITVNAIAPGFIKSDMTDKIPVIMLDKILEIISFKEMGLPEDVANLAVFLASDKAKYISGQIIRVDGAMMI
ncbi:MAG: 3-oxoacyl-ACP reductase FabG [Nanoarchaeota archaeon]